MHITEWKKPIWKGYILYDSNYIIFWKRQNCGDSKKISGCGGRGMNRQNIEDFLGEWKISYSVWYYNDGYVFIYLAKSIECTIPRVNPNVKYRFSVIM